MGIARSTYYHKRKQRVDEADLLTAIIAICDESKPMAGAAYGQNFSTRGSLQIISASNA